MNMAQPQAAEAKTADKAPTRKPSAGRVKKRERKNISFRGGACQRLVQQHHRHHHRRCRATPFPGRLSGAHGFKGSRKSTPYAAQVAADDAVAKRPWSMANADARSRSEGSGFGSRIGAARACRRSVSSVTSIRDVTPDPAQRLPSAKAPPRLICHGDRCRQAAPIRARRTFATTTCLTDVRLVMTIRIA